MGEANRLGEVRARHFLTQQQLAERAGVAKVTIARIESGVTRPTFRTVRKLAAALDVNPEEIAPDPALLRPRRSRQPRAGV